MITQKPDNFPDIKHFLKERGIDAYHLQAALDAYLIEVDQVMEEEYDPYENPHGYVQAKGYEQASEKFRDVLSAEIDD